MSMFSTMMGTNPFAGVLLKILGFTDPVTEIPRPRDCYVCPQGYVTVLTRTGGGNRAFYAEQNAELEARAGFVSSQDWERDSTYAEWRYTPPQEHALLVRQLADCGARCNLTEKFDALLADMGSENPRPSTKVALERLEPLLEQIRQVMEA